MARKKATPRLRSGAKAVKRAKPKAAKSKSAKPTPRLRSGPKLKPSTVVALSPKTLKQIQPKKGALVFYGIKEGKKIRLIETEFPQKFSKKDMDFIAAEIAKSAEHFVLYESHTAKPVKLPYKQVQRRKLIEKIPVKKPITQFKTYYNKITKRSEFLRDSRGRKIPQTETKLAAPTPGRKMRASLFQRGRHLRPLTQFNKLSKTDIIRNERLITLTPSEKFSRKLVLNGRTIKESIKNVARKDPHRRGAKGVIVETRLFLPGDDSPIRITIPVAIGQNFVNRVAKDIRWRLIRMGLRFTSVHDLEKIERDAEEAGEEAIDLTSIGGHSRGSVSDLSPIFPETGKRRSYPPGDKRNPRVYVQFRLIPWEKS